MQDSLGDLQELYQQVILDHGRNPRNFHTIESADAKADGFNPLCGDQITAFLNLEGDRIIDIAFTGKGCAICTASASMMTQFAKGKLLADIAQTFEDFHQMVAGNEMPDAAARRIGKLAVFQGVRKYPVRVKCATLPWHTLNAALNHRHEPVSTE